MAKEGWYWIRFVDVGKWWPAYLQEEDWHWENDRYEIGPRIPEPPQQEDAKP